MTDARKLYLDLMEKCLIGTIYEDVPQDPWLDKKFDTALRDEGKDWPSVAHSMIGMKRLHHLRQACEYVLEHNIPGDFIETGIWRGGACIMMRAVLMAYGITDRNVWCADSFAGLPMPDFGQYPQDVASRLYKYEMLAVPLAEVQSNFAKYGLLDAQVKFLKGWFKDTLSAAPIEKLAILRLDGDMYQSTKEALEALYDKLSPGGILIVDDAGAIDACSKAITDFRTARNIRETIQKIDWTGRFWKKAAA